MDEKAKQPGTPGPVKHPTTEEWMSFLYGELPVARHVELKAHAASCAECGLKVQGWRATMTTLDKSVLPKRQPARQQVSSGRNGPSLPRLCFRWLPGWTVHQYQLGRSYFAEKLARTAFLATRSRAFKRSEQPGRHCNFGCGRRSDSSHGRVFSQNIRAAG